MCLISESYGMVNKGKAHCSDSIYDIQKHFCKVWERENGDYGVDVEENHTFVHTFIPKQKKLVKKKNVSPFSNARTSPGLGIKIFIYI